MRKKSLLDKAENDFINQEKKVNSIKKRLLKSQFKDKNSQELKLIEETKKMNLLKIKFIGKSIEQAGRDLVKSISDIMKEPNKSDAIIQAVNSALDNENLVNEFKSTELTTEINKFFLDDSLKKIKSAYSDLNQIIRDMN